MSSKFNNKIAESVEKSLVSEVEQPYHIPANWVWVKLGSYFEHVKEQIQPLGDENYIGLEHLQKGGGILEVGIAEGIKSKKVVFKKGDVLYGKLRPYLNKHAIADNDGVASTDILVYRNKNNIANSLLNNYLGLPHVLIYANENSSGINLPRVSPKVMNSLPFPLPPLKEQKRINDKVERLLNKIDEAKQLINEAKETFELRRLAILIKAFRGELGNYKVKYVELGNVITIRSGTSISEHSLQIDGDIPYFKVADMNVPENKKEMVLASNFISHGEVKISQILPRGTVIFPKRGGAIKTNKKRILSEDALCDLNIMGVICPDNINPYYLYYWFLSIDLGQLDNGSSVPQINNKDIQPLSFPMTDTKAQEEIIRTLDLLFEKENEVLEIITNKLHVLDLLKQSILFKAFKGELGTNNPKEENVIELLKEVLQKQL